MYDVEMKLRSDVIRGQGPFVMPDIRTVSVNSSRIILANATDQLYTFRPDEIVSMNLWPKKND